MVKGKNTKQAESELANLKARQDGLRDAVSKLESELLLRRSELYQSETNDHADELNAEIAKVKGEMHQAGQSLVEIAANAEKWKESLSKIRDRAHAAKLGTFQGDS